MQKYTTEYYLKIRYVHFLFMPPPYKEDIRVKILSLDDKYFKIILFSEQTIGISNHHLMNLMT